MGGRFGVGPGKHVGTSLCQTQVCAWTQFPSNVEGHASPPR